MSAIIPRTPTATETARSHPCPLCSTPHDVPCQPKPEGDHLAAGRLTRDYMAAVLGELVIITRLQLVPADADPGGAR